MFSLQSFFGKDNRFYDLLEASALEAHRAAQILKKILREPSPAHLSELREARLKNKAHSEQVSELAVKTFVTILEREDLEALAVSLYKIPKPMEKFVERFVIVKDFVGGDMFSRQSDLVESAAATVVRMVSELRKGINVEVIKRLNTELQALEAEADTLEIELLRNLFNPQEDPRRVIILKDLYDLLEKVIDRCRDAGNVVTHVFLKNS